MVSLIALLSTNSYFTLILRPRLLSFGFHKIKEINVSYSKLEESNTTLYNQFPCYNLECHLEKINSMYKMTLLMKCEFNEES
jgi:hypothetical protein